MAKKKARKSTKKVKVALIGAGGMANGVHYPSLAGFKDVELVGLCDLVPEKVKATADKFGIKKTFSDYREMLAETKPKAVYALMPPHHLYDVAMDIIQAGLDLFIEKPPAVTTFQTDCLARAAAKRKLITGVGFQRRYHPLFTRCLKAVRKHGPIHQTVATFYKNLPPTEIHPYYRGAIDILTSDAVHVVDALRYFCGGEVRRVASDVRKIDCWYDTCFNAIVSFDNGATGILLANWRCGSRRLTLELHSPGSSAYMDAGGSAHVFADNKPLFETGHIDEAGSESMHVHQGFCAQARAFIDAVKSRHQLHNNLPDAVKTMRLVEQIFGNNISDN